MAMLKEFSIQLYSLKEETAKDFLGVLDKLGEIGYTGVEFAGYGEIPAEVMKSALDKNGLKSIGSHVGLEKLEKNLENELKYNKVLGTEYIICPHSQIKNFDDAVELAKKLNIIGKKVQDAGFKFGYHNHDFEFVKHGEKFLLDVLFDNLTVGNNIMELDVYWAKYAGVDVLSYIESNKDKIKLLHLKQIKDMESKKCVDLNEGIIDFKEIIAKALAVGVEHFVLEQEEFAIDPYVSVRNGFEHIISL